MYKTTETEAQINALLDEVTKLTSVIQRKVLDGESAAEPRERQIKIERHVAKLRDAAASAKSKAGRAFARQVADSSEQIAHRALKFVEDKILRLQLPKKPGDEK
jgi:hypothetical protein